VEAEGDDPSNDSPSEESYTGYEDPLIDAMEVFEAALLQPVPTDTTYVDVSYDYSLVPVLNDPEDFFRERELLDRFVGRLRS
jgi:hypothetical protein